MAQLDTTQTWSTGDTVTAAKLNQMITGATVRSEIISNQVEQTAAANSSDMVVIESGGSLYKLSIGTLSQSPVWDANKIQSKAVASTAPTDGQVLIWDNANTQWSPSDVSASTLAANSVGASELADNAVDTAAIVDDAVTQDKIANDSIGSDQIASNAVGASELADNAVDTAAIVDGAVTSAKLASGSLAGSPRAPRRVHLTSTTTWTVPSGVTEIYVEMVGGGGGFGNNSRGGGGGAYVATHLDVTAGGTITFTVGAGGTSVHAAGGDTTFTHDSTTYTAGGASWAAGHNANGTGGVASGGEINVDGFGALNTDSGYPAFGPWPKYSWGSGSRTANSGIYQGTSTLSTSGKGGAVLITY